MQWKPNVTVAAIVENDGRFLLVEETEKDVVVFNQPAGHLEKDETLPEAVIREVMEETAWEFEPESLVGVYLYPNPRVDIIYLRFCFAGKGIKEHAGRELDDGIIRATWLTQAEIESQQDKMRSPMVLRCINDYLSGKRYPLEMLHHYLEK